MGSNPILRISNFFEKSFTIFGSIGVGWSRVVSIHLRIVRRGIGLVDVSFEIYGLRRLIAAVRLVARRRGSVLIVGLHTGGMVDFRGSRGFLNLYSKYRAGSISNFRVRTRWKSPPAMLVVVDGKTDLVEEASGLNILIGGICRIDFDPILFSYPVVVGGGDFYPLRLLFLLVRIGRMVRRIILKN